MVLCDIEQHLRRPLGKHLVGKVKKCSFVRYTEHTRYQMGGREDAKLAARVVSHQAFCGLGISSRRIGAGVYYYY